MDESPDIAGGASLVRGSAIVGLSLAGTAVARPVAAHGGSVHRSIPHWVLLGVVVAGLAVVTASAGLARRSDIGPRRTIQGLFAGAILAVVGVVALVEFQVEPLSTDATPIPRAWYPAVAFATGTSVVLGSVAVGLWRWPDRPAYIALGSALGLYVAYPTLVPGIAVLHPAGYALVFAVVALVGVVLWRDVVPGIRGVDRLSRRTGVGAAVLFLVFFLFSTGQFTLNPDTGVSGPEGPFVVVAEFANPLVMWPAVEFYFPSVPVFGAMSVGTLIMFGVLGVLVGANATLATRVWQSDREVVGSETAFGAVATTGATACCCCAPAVYGVASAALGLSASPLYWMFLDSASPLGSLFFVAAVGFMTASGIHLANVADACRVPG